MKTLTRRAASRAALAVTAAFFIGANFTAHAQTQALAATKLVAEPVVEEIAQPDSVVRIVADAKELPRVSPDKLPVHGTYWVVIGGGSYVLPMPFISYDQANSPVYSLGKAGQFLVDATRGVAPQPTWKQAARGVTAAALLERQGNAILDLVEQVKEAQVNAELAALEAASGKMTTDGTLSRMSLSGMSGSQLNSLESQVDYGTNLWLEIPAVTNSAAYVVLHNVTQGAVYELMTKPALTDPAWLPEMALHPVPDQDWIDATVPMLNRTNALFFWARDWTGIDENTNSLPDWWEWENFGNLNQTANGDYDGDGDSNGLEYTNHTDPNTIQFALSVTNEFVNSLSVSLQANVFSGTPFSGASVVDSTNFSAANWTAYTSSNITVNPGSAEGWHQIWIGLRGRSDTAQQTWQSKRIKLDRTPPTLVITKPTPGTVSSPIIQLQGYCPEALSSISYDLVTTNGTITNQPVVVLDQAYDTNTWDFTTNNFQCFDVPLSEGTNTVTFHATDFSGNVTVTNFTFTLNYSGKTNPPTLNLNWPRNGTRIGGGNFTLRGSLDDSTVQITAQIVDPNGATTTADGIVGRNGDFRVENLPLTSGTNAVTLVATDIVGNRVTTNLNVIRSDVTLTLSTGMGQSAGGTISDTNYIVWVNGARGTVNNDGTWSVTNPNLTLNNSVAQARAIPNSDNSGSGSSFGDGSGGNNPGSSGATEVEQRLGWGPDGFIYRKVVQREYVDDVISVYASNWGSLESHKTSRIYDVNWQETTGGTGHDHMLYNPPHPYFPSYDASFTWSGGRWPVFGSGSVVYVPSGPNSTNTGAPNEATQWGATSFGTIDFTSARGQIHRSCADQAELALLTGDDSDSTITELYQITGMAEDDSWTTHVIGINEEALWVINPIPPEQIQIGALGRLDTNGTLWAALPTHTNVNVTPHVAGAGWYYVYLQSQPYKLVSQCVATTPANRARTTIGVGEQVTVNFSPNLPANINANWSTTGGGISTNLAKQITFTAPNNAATVTITATVKGQACRMNFNVREPTGIIRSQITGTNSYPLAAAGAGMTNILWIGPTNVSFYRVNVMEVGEDATNIWGFYSQWTPQQLHHNSNPNWVHLTSDNRFNDNAAFAAGGLLTWTAGGFEWNIPQRWQVVGSGVTNSMAGCNQVFSIDANGTARVTKYGNWIQRTTNNIITTN